MPGRLLEAALRASPARHAAPSRDALAAPAHTLAPLAPLAPTPSFPGQNRHLVRWWVHSDANARPIPPHYAPRSNVGAQGGFLVPDYDDLSKQRLPLYPYARHDGLGQSAVF